MNGLRIDPLNERLVHNFGGAVATRPKNIHLRHDTSDIHPRVVSKGVVESDRGTVQISFLATVHSWVRTARRTRPTSRSTPVAAPAATPPAALELYAEAFDAAGALDKLEGFAASMAPTYGLPRNSGTVTLRRESWNAPEQFVFGDAQLKPLRGGEPLLWRLA